MEAVEQATKLGAPEYSRRCTSLPACVTQRVWYYVCMTKLLDQAIERLRRLPVPMQDSAARTSIRQLEEELRVAAALSRAIS